MPTYIVFATTRTGTPPGDPLMVSAIITEADTERAAADRAVSIGMAHGSEVHACDLAVAQTFAAVTSVSLEDPAEGREATALFAPESSPPSPPPLIATRDNGTSV